MTRSSFACFWANAEILDLAAATSRRGRWGGEAGGRRQPNVRRSDMKRCKMHSQWWCDMLCWSWRWSWIWCLLHVVVVVVVVSSRMRLMSMITRGSERRGEGLTRTGCLRCCCCWRWQSRLKLMRLTTMLEMMSRIMLRCLPRSFELGACHKCRTPRYWCLWLCHSLSYPPLPLPPPSTIHLYGCLRNTLRFRDSGENLHAHETSSKMHH